jgi:hypothetical protein
MVDQLEYRVLHLGGFVYAVSRLDEKRSAGVNLEPSLQPQIFRPAELGVAGAAFIVRMMGHCCSKASVRFRFSVPREILFDCAT